MDETKKPEEIDDSKKIVDEIEDLEIDNLIPTMEKPSEIITPDYKECIVGDQELLDLYDEILENCRTDRSNIDEVLANFVDMVMNDGDASSASKEAIVNLIKIKSDTSDKMTKVADLKTRIKLKEKDTFPRYLAQQQNNKVVIETGSKREMLKMLEKKREGK